MPTEEKRDTVRFRPALVERIEAYRQATGQTRNAAINELLAWALDQKDLVAATGSGAAGLIAGETAQLVEALLDEATTMMRRDTLTTLRLVGWCIATLAQMNGFVSGEEAGSFVREKIAEARAKTDNEPAP